ncbi:uncharacterized protein LOC109788280 [Cajanus cajan]|nr:uncharacterized protein LOC109788280 [Cajanus cajan]
MFREAGESWPVIIPNQELSQTAPPTKVLFSGELEVAADEDEHAGVDAGGLAVDGGDGVVALLEREGSEFGDDVGGALDLLALEGEHGTILIETHQACSVGVEGAVVVLYKAWKQGLETGVNGGL